MVTNWREHPLASVTQREESTVALKPRGPPATEFST